MDKSGAKQTLPLVHVLSTARDVDGVVYSYPQPQPHHTIQRGGHNFHGLALAEQATNQQPVARRIACSATNDTHCRNSFFHIDRSQIDLTDAQNKHIHHEKFQAAAAYFSTPPFRKKGNAKHTADFYWDANCPAVVTPINKQ